MVTCRPVSEIEKMMRTHSATSKRQIASVLFDCGFVLGDTIRMFKDDQFAWTLEDGILLLFVKTHHLLKESNHWAIFDGRTKMVFDPGLKKQHKPRVHASHMTGRVTSFSRITKI